VETFFPFADLMNRYGISASESDQYAKIEENFQRHIVRNHLYYRGQYLKKRVLMSALIPYINRTNQQLIQEYEEKIQQLLSDRNALSTEICSADEDRKRLIEQAKVRDDLITLLHNSYSMKIGKTLLFPFKYIRDLLSRT
jgi:predicted ATP-dependent Lon-type protease